MSQTPHTSHPRLEQRKRHGAALTSDEHVGFNGLLAAGVTRWFGSMWAFYVLVVWMLGWMALASIGFWWFRFDKYPFNFLLFLSNLVQLWALPVLAVGQQVLSRSSDKQALQTYQDAEALLQITDQMHGLMQTNSRLVGKIHDLIEINNNLTAEIHRVVSAPKT